MTQIINQDPHGLPVTLSSGAVLALGETGDADLTDPHDQALVEAGTVARADSLESLRKIAADLGIEGRSTMNRKALERAIADAERAQAEARSDAERAAAAARIVPGDAGAATTTTEKES